MWRCAGVEMQKDEGIHRGAAKVAESEQFDFFSSANSVLLCLKVFVACANFRISHRGGTENTEGEFEVKNLSLGTLRLCGKFRFSQFGCGFCRARYFVVTFLSLYSRCRPFRQRSQICGADVIVVKQALRFPFAYYASAFQDVGAPS